jgi:hypothetical protein
MYAIATLSFISVAYLAYGKELTIYATKCVLLIKCVPGLQDHM